VKKALAAKLRLLAGKQMKFDKKGDASAVGINLQELFKPVRKLVVKKSILDPS